LANRFTSGLVVTIVLFGAAANLAAQESTDTAMMVDVAERMTSEQIFDKASLAYDSRDYARAAELYQSILSRSEESGALYFNLANATFKNGDLGHAVLYFHRALRLDPGDEDIAANLEFAKAFTSLQMEGVELNPINAFFQSLVGTYRLSQLAWLSSGLFILLILLLTLRWGMGQISYWVRIGITTSLILLITSCLLTSFKYRRDYLIERAVLIAEECPVRTGPSESLDIELQGAPGLVVEILSESGDYYNILFENKRRGWIKKGLVAVI